MIMQMIYKRKGVCSTIIGLVTSGY